MFHVMRIPEHIRGRDPRNIIPDDAKPVFSTPDWRKAQSLCKMLNDFNSCPPGPMQPVCGHHFVAGDAGDELPIEQPVPEVGSGSKSQTSEIFYRNALLPDGSLRIVRVGAWVGTWNGISHNWFYTARPDIYANEGLAWNFHEVPSWIVDPQDEVL